MLKDHYCWHLFLKNPFSKHEAILQNYFCPTKIHQNKQPQQVLTGSFVTSFCFLPPILGHKIFAVSIRRTSCGCHLGIHTSADIPLK